MCPTPLPLPGPFAPAFERPVFTVFREVRTDMAPIGICLREVTIQEMPCREGIAAVIAIALEMNGNKDRLTAEPLLMVSSENGTCNFHLPVSRDGEEMRKRVWV